MTKTGREKKLLGRWVDWLEHMRNKGIKNLKKKKKKILCNEEKPRRNKNRTTTMCQQWDCISKTNTNKIPVFVELTF